MTTLKGTEASLSYVKCFLYLISSLINVSIFSYYVAGYYLDRTCIAICDLFGFHSHVIFFSIFLSGAYVCL